MKQAALIALLILASCSPDSQTTAIETTAVTMTTLAEAAAPTSSTTTTLPPPTTTTTAATTTTTLPPNAAPAFGLTQVVFGEGAFVVITNWGNDTGSLLGFWLAQGDLYRGLPHIALSPGEQALIGLGTLPPPELSGIAATVDLGPVLGVLSLDFGEIGLYDAAATDDPNHVVAYVAWGEAEHARSAVAMEAGAWEEGSVDVFDDAPSISSGVYPATNNLSWFADLGG